MTSVISMLTATTPLVSWAYTDEGTTAARTTKTERNAKRPAMMSGAGTRPDGEPLREQKRLSTRKGGPCKSNERTNERTINQSINQSINQPIPGAEREQSTQISTRSTHSTTTTASACCLSFCESEESSRNLDAHTPRGERLAKPKKAKA